MYAETYQQKAFMKYDIYIIQYLIYSERDVRGAVRIILESTFLSSLLCASQIVFEIFLSLNFFLSQNSVL